MNMRIGINSFRCFSNVENIRIAPITLLIGENSTGKSSFLSALRRIYSMGIHANSDPFNSDPYFLGSFEQISHFRGGKAGRAKEFSFNVKFDRDDLDDDLFPNGKSRGEVASHTISYRKGRLRAEVSSYQFCFDDIVVDVDLKTARSPLVVRSGKDVIVHMEGESIERYTMRRDPQLLWYLLNEVGSGLRTDLLLSEDQKSNLMALSKKIRDFQQQNQKSVFASAPVRIQPRRIYIPSELASTIGGEQVPLEMANEKLLSPTRWKMTKDKMIEFGSRSGLFEDIDIKRFGRSDGDPFQIQIKNQGPAANIVDVGYGVSQAIPLLYPLQLQGRHNVFLLQQPEVHMHPRAQAEFGSLIVDLYRSSPGKQYIIETHSDFIVDRIRSEIRNKNIRHERVSILYFKKIGLDVKIFEIGLDESGNIVNYPEKFRDFFLDEQARVLGI